MLCLGRGGYDRGNPTIRAEIPKLDQKWVDLIPLVVYIPPKSEGVDDDEDETETPTPTPTHTYPPKAPTEAPVPAVEQSQQPVASSSSTSSIAATHPDSGSRRSRRRGRFLFLRRKAGPSSSSAAVDAASSTSTSAGPSPATKSSSRKPPPPTSPSKKGSAAEPEREEDPWEARFERGEHPFVTLDGNRAACAICLCDFVEPKRRGAVRGEGDLEEGGASPATQTPTPPEGEDAGLGGKTRRKKSTPKPVKDTIDEEQAGIPGEPLRLLTCGHVFHVSLLCYHFTPWWSPDRS